MKPRSFTTIELLVSGAIVAVLAAIIYATFGPARESARRTSCASNLHQIGTAVALYISDYGGVEPTLGVRMSPYDLGLPAGGSTSGDSLYYQYIRNKSVRYCPSYHDTQPISGLGSTYQWPLGLTEDNAPEIDVPGIVARRGQDYVLVACDQHNAALDFANQPRWATKNVLVLRISQRVESKQVKARMISSVDW